jgi:hypothetical protein
MKRHVDAAIAPAIDTLCLPGVHNAERGKCLPRGAAGRLAGDLATCAIASATTKVAGEANSLRFTTGTANVNITG